MVYLGIGCLAYLYVFFASNGDTLVQLAASQNLAEILAKPLLALQNDCYVYMEEAIANPMTWVLGFYFAVEIGLLKKNLLELTRRERFRLAKLECEDEQSN